MRQQALRAADEAQCTPDAGCDSPQRARDAVIAESVALHFLEDAGSSGHVIGDPVDDDAKASRIGTHDDYCARGITTTTWDQVAYSAHGDAHMRRVDRIRMAAAVSTSLAQVADALLGKFKNQLGGCDPNPVDGCRSTIGLHPAKD